MDTLLLIDVCNLLNLLSEVPTLLNKVLNFCLKWLAVCLPPICQSTEFVVLKLFLLTALMVFQ